MLAGLPSNAVHSCCSTCTCSAPVLLGCVTSRTRWASSGALLLLLVTLLPASLPSATVSACCSAASASWCAAWGVFHSMRAGAAVTTPSGSMSSSPELPPSALTPAPDASVTSAQRIIACTHSVSCAWLSKPEAGVVEGAGTGAGEQVQCRDSSARQREMQDSSTWGAASVGVAPASTNPMKRVCAFAAGPGPNM
eukprot:1161978-Pelagomonas_calceolata.AAC.1